MTRLGEGEENISAGEMNDSVGEMNGVAMTILCGTIKMKLLIFG
jgi:hypothetical protein